MASMRAIRPEIFIDDWIGTLDYFHRWLWIGIFAVVADDQGRFWMNPLKIRAAILPHPLDAEISDDQIAQAVKSFEEAGKIHAYYTDGKTICQIGSWWKHQQPRWANKSEYPPPAKWKDRERYGKGQGKQPYSLNWDLPGGFARAPAAATKNESAAHNMYADNIDMISPFEEQILNQLVKDHTQEWVVGAIEIAIKNNVKKLSYISAILEKWKAAGKATLRKKDAYKDYLDDEFSQFIES